MIQTENDFDSMLDKLASESNPIKINKLALMLAETGNLKVPPVLLELIQRPDLIDSRATLVNCLGFYKLENYFNLLISLVIQGNWEVAHEAHSLLCSIDYLSGENVSSAYSSLDKLDFLEFETWRIGLLKDLQGMF